MSKHVREKCGKRADGDPDGRRVGRTDGESDGRRVGRTVCIFIILSSKRGITPTKIDGN